MSFDVINGNRTKPNTNENPYNNEAPCATIIFIALSFFIMPATWLSRSIDCRKYK